MSEQNIPYFIQAIMIDCEAKTDPCSACFVRFDTIVSIRKNNFSGKFGKYLDCGGSILRTTDGSEYVAGPEYNKLITMLTRDNRFKCIPL